MTPYLPDDCIYDILEYLQDFRDFRSILFNCMLVNRFWCRTAIPLLYANPFATCKKGIILTFTLCFSKEEILQLKNQMNNNFMININDEYKPLFDYPKYLKIYNYSSINFTILGWINSYKRKYKKFCSIFNQLILNHCINIDRFNIDLVKLDSFIEFNPELNIPISNLTKLNSLTLELAKLQAFKHEIGKEFLNNIIIHCLNLKKLEIFEITQPIVSRDFY
ncbi:hypothetical protein GLOIN_2v1774869 [Rhizophagus clarus]|uniref:F-box domain-containing protein n=1 Tax=Rhizophagus clarus TaxID=94130 RepID=A0A8H3KTN2_9GLOM|nr:hypothetical protein GLOIN_2v1774869 [Rhizophagus clarus]